MKKKLKTMQKEYDGLQGKIQKNLEYIANDLARTTKAKKIG